MPPGTTALTSAIPAPPHWIPAPVAIAVLAAVALSAAWPLRRHFRKPSAGQRRSTAAVRVAAVAAIGCTAYSADTSWRFAADYLDMGSTIERAAMFAAAELALFSTALLARANLNGPKQAPGLPGTLTWVITGVQIVPAYAESGLVGGTVRAFVGPVLAALLWHLAMGIELRHCTPDADSRSLTAVLARQARERLLARLGIADQDADFARIIRERALDQAVTLILRAETMTPKQRAKRRGRLPASGPGTGRCRPRRAPGRAAAAQTRHPPTGPRSGLRPTARPLARPGRGFDGRLSSRPPESNPGDDATDPAARPKPETRPHHYKHGVDSGQEVTGW